MLVFDLIVLLFSLIARKKTTKGKYVFFLVLYGLLILVNGICAADYFFIFPNNPHMSSLKIETWNKVLPLLGFAVDIIGILLLRRWRVRYLKATMGEEAYLAGRKKKGITSSGMIIAVIVALIVFMVITMAAEVMDGKSWLPHETAKTIASVLALGLIVTWIVSRFKKENVYLKAAVSCLLLLTIVFGGITLAGSLHQPFQDYAKKQAMVKYETKAKLEVQQSVRDQLKAPDSAKFGEYKMIEKDGKWMVYGTVTAPNSFGVMVTSEYVATYDANSDTVSSTMIQP